jgi:hypothetical protein
MSAYFCSTSTFQLIATYAATLDASADLKTVWRSLIQENLKSLNYRYPRDQSDNINTARDEIARITDQPILPLPAPGIIKSAIKEYNYQACEHPEYSMGVAGQLVARLLDTIETPQPAPENDPMTAARASLTAAFAAPSAAEPAPAPEPPAQLQR